MCAHLEIAAFRSHFSGLPHLARTKIRYAAAHPGIGWRRGPVFAAMKDNNDSDGNGGDGPGNGTGLVTKTRPKTKKPSLYKVLLLNDDYTPMEFVVHILEKIFSKNREEAVDVMLHVHRHGVGMCGVFTYEVAETKVAQVIEFARRHQHPLQCTMEKE
jgi:ATP-dependent Clp protease adaptor protein ClpS